MGLTEDEIQAAFSGIFDEAVPNEQPLGIHQIEKFTQNLMKRLGKEGYYTNTSLRRTSKSRMVAAGIPREITKKRIRHLSKIDTVYINEHVMERKISDALSLSIAVVVVPLHSPLLLPLPYSASLIFLSSDVLAKQRSLTCSSFGTASSKIPLNAAWIPSSVKSTYIHSTLQSRK